MTIKHVSFNEREEKNKRTKKRNNHRKEKVLRNVLNSGSFYNNIDYAVRTLDYIEDIQ